MQVRPPDIADQERVAGENQPGLAVPAATVGHHVRVVGRRMPGRRERAHARVPERKLCAVLELLVLELDPRSSRQVRRRVGRLDERRQPRDVVRLHVRLEHGRDLGADGGRRRQVLVD